MWSPLLSLRITLPFLCRPILPFGRCEPPFQVLGLHPQTPPGPIPPQVLNCLLYLVLHRYQVVLLHWYYCDRYVLSRKCHVALEVDPLRCDPLERSSNGRWRMVDCSLVPSFQSYPCLPRIWRFRPEYSLHLLSRCLYLTLPVSFEACRDCSAEPPNLCLH